MEPPMGDAGHYGRLTLAPPHEQPSCDDAPSTGVRQINYVWTPSSELGLHLPQGFKIPIACIEGFGMRMFRGVHGPKALHISASLAGLAIMEFNGLLSAEHRGIYDKMRFLFQKGAKLRERLTFRSSLAGNELYVRRKYAFGSDADVMPDDLGVLEEVAERWSIERLLLEGKSAAQEVGFEHPTPQVQMKYGIDAEARIHPKDVADLSADEVRLLFRMLMFDVGPPEIKIDEDLKVRVFGRIFNLVRDKLELSTDKFNTWFFDNFDQIVKRIATAKRPDGPIPQAMVRQAVVELAFDSWQYVGQTLSILMESVAKLIEPPLTLDERRAFEALYKCNLQLGDFPLTIFHELFPAVGPAVQAILASPNDPSSWGRFHRALEIYATMIIRRRFADLKKKNSKGLRESRSSESALRVQEARPDVETDEFTELARDFLAWKQYECGCSRAAKWNAILSSRQDDEKNVVLLVSCSLCGRQEEKEYSFKDYSGFANRDQEE